MASDTHYFNLTFNYIAKNSDQSFTATNSEDKVDIVVSDKTITCKAQLVYTTFNRKVYHPNEIVADICFGSNEILSNRSIFFNSKVTLTRYDTNQTSPEQESYKGFYVYNVLPLKIKDTDLYIRFHIFSYDHQLTLKKYSRTYVAKKLGADILAAEKGDSGLEVNYLSPNTNIYNKLKFPISVETTDLDHLRDSNTSAESIQPYLVQYNESFYDFMVRTANRCGEFFFWEEEKLRMGRSCEDYTEFSDNIAADCNVYYRIVNTSMDGSLYRSRYYVLDDQNRDEDFMEVSTESDISKVDEAARKKYDDGETQYLSFGNDNGTLNPALTLNAYFYNNEVNHDVYRTRIYKSRFDSSYHETVGNVNRYGTSILSKLLNETTLYDFLKKFTYSNVLMGLFSLAQWGHKNSIGNEHHLHDEKLDESLGETDRKNSADRRMIEKKEDDKDNDEENIVYNNLFTTADTSGHLTNSSFYKEIRVQEESLSRQLITFTTSTPNKFRLGQKIKYGTWDYYIIQIKMKLGTNTSKFSDIDPDAEAEFRNMTEAMEVVAIPEDNNGIVYPPLHPAGHVRHSEPQVAFVADFLDPQKRGRVRIRYPWQSKNDTEASPWIRVLTPSATPGTGCSFELAVNDEVLVDYESNNIERPYVAGTLYNKNNHTPFGRGDMALISKNGHGIAFDDPIDYSKFIAGISPFYNFINQFLAIDASDWKKSLKLTGGTTISDAYGFYKIDMSTDQRKIDISSPFGTVNIDAFQGISIEAPNGDISIKGQNINIEAGNAIKVTSGTNIEKKFHWGDASGEDFAWQWMGIVGGASDYMKSIAQFVDLDLLRKLIQVFLRPIDGTLEIKSNQYLLLEAGHGEAVVQRDRYLNAEPTKKGTKGRIFSTEMAARNTANIALRHVIYLIRVNVKALIDDIPTQQKRIAKLKVAYDAARTASLTAGLADQNCPDSAAILTAIYNNGGNPVQKDYIGQDNGDLHLRAFPQIPRPANPAPAPQNQGVLGKVKAFAKGAYDRVAELFTSHERMRTEMGRIEADTNTKLQQMSRLVANADELAQVAYQYFDYIRNLSVGLNNIVAPLVANPGNNPNASYIGELDASRANVAHINDIFNCLNALPELQAGTLTDQQLADAKKYIMHQWFAECLDLINQRQQGAIIGSDPQAPYTFTQGPPCTDTWDRYVRGLSFQGALDTKWKEKIGDPFSDMWMQYCYFGTDLRDRDHWEAGKPGQIIFSDQPQQSFYFDRNGVTQVYENEWTSQAPSIDKLKTMLNDLN